ncbi:MobF family relaxase [Pseudarthrobacter niigatensis]|uniref:Conjugative relaxase-like TrwC/TraI family protein n=1 Tax=Pseudarthrobacter niigatensis TaxID=369935 RepID=A0AAJ1SPL4_9MICC|nr:MobF family relaxase [Pseudarthrobacter niigatensis]MDQ0144695.1 conjugative relaxase-like TrwC/TraI family protein [Pseudarthrobacter niigatensis]MDQ0265341.1 conjugative relaxase-like TrwC/TraI family protein [Pseudarthrobacter niigatensis]
MSIARLSAQSGLRYLFKTTMTDDVSVSPSNSTTYYMKAGTPQGHWIGGGLNGISKTLGDVVTEIDAKAVFDLALHPQTGTPLGRPHARPAAVENKAGQSAQRHAVVGFDLTFSVPKSVSVLWALSPHSKQQQILRTHHDAVEATLAWLEKNVIHTRAGRNGVAHIGTRGAVAAAFDHWESRTGDPQLHTHLVIANRTQRATDGAWVTLDSRALYKAVVAASEHYNGLLFDALQRDLGCDPEIRASLTKTHNPSQQLTGIDEELLSEFSNRSRLIDLETDRLVAAWTKDHGQTPSATTTIKLRQQATLSTRAPKPESPTALHQLSEQWQARAIAKGFQPSDVLAHTINRSRVAPFTFLDFTPDWTSAVATIARERVAEKRSTWNRWNLLAEAERVCTQIRCSTSSDRAALIDAVATAAEEQSVPLNEYRYSLPPNGGPDLQLNQRSVFDFHGSRLYTDASTLACEDAIMTARKDNGGPAVRPSVVMDSLDSGRRQQVPRLHTDQRAAVADVALSRNRLDAIVGPAGTGKTTTLGAVKAVWEAEHGAGSVIGLAPAAASAAVLSHELRITTENVAKWLHESMGQSAATRGERFFHIQELLGASNCNDRRSIAFAQEAAQLAATQQRWCFHPNQLVIIDEASMVSTFQLAALVQQATEAGAKILLVGDPGQLDAIDAGGVLGWLDRQGLATRLRTIWRFHEEWERSSSLKLRAGDYSAIEDYEQHRRIRHGSYLSMLDQAYLAWQTDMQSGKSSILIAADNETVSMLNERARADLVAQGVVDAELAAQLADGLQAGSGDTIIARGNNRQLIDSEDEFVRNGTLFDVRAVNRHDGSILAVRRETGASVVLPRTYLETSVELGYATTAHRSQGLTVDTGHTVVTQGRLTRELLYVSMTRGRSGNVAYVSEGDDSEHQAVDPSLQLSWRSILGEILAAEGAERTAHEVREAESRKADNLERLYAEYDYLAQIAAGEDLRRCLGKRAPLAVQELSASPSWGAAVAAWRKATAIGRHGAEHVMEQTLQDSHSAHDPLALLSARLRRYTRGTPTAAIDPLHESFSALGPELADMIAQLRERIRRRTETVTRAALMQDVPWKDELTAAVGGTESFGRLVRQVALFRDRWGIYDSHLPLGAAPADYEWEQLHEREKIQNAISSAGNCQAGPHQGVTPSETHRFQHVVLTSSGWQI